MKGRLSRRDFLVSSAAVSAGSIAAQGVFAQANANEKLTFALIGAGGQGTHIASRMIDAGQGKVELAAVADCDQSQLTKAMQALKSKLTREPDQYRHFGKVIERKDIDFVVVATPDHWHAIPTILACQAGKDVYVEKPCAHNIREGRAMVRAARKFERIVQVGQHQRSDAHFAEAVDYIRSRKLGSILRTLTMTYSNETPDGIGNPPDQPSAPAGVDYDLWLGPARKRPFNQNRFHGKFRWFFDYAGGMMGDWNVHLQDVVHWAMGEHAPKSVSAVGGKRILNDNRETPDMMDVVYEYPGFTHVYTMGKCYHRGTYHLSHGIEFLGTLGSMFVKRSHWAVTPEPRPAHVEKPPGSGTVHNAPRETPEGFEKKGHSDSLAHCENFLKAVRSRRVADLNCDIEIGHRTATVCHLGNISCRLGRQIFWNARDEMITDANDKPDSEANRYLTREYRKGYELPEV